MHTSGGGASIWVASMGVHLGCIHSGCMGVCASIWVEMHPSPRGHTNTCKHVRLQAVIITKIYSGHVAVVIFLKYRIVV